LPNRECDEDPADKKADAAVVPKVNRGDPLDPDVQNRKNT
jgi:hypothetical protein